jgi:hypothetical protein
LKATEIALAYAEEEREVTSRDDLLFRRWSDLAKKNTEGSVTKVHYFF